MSTTFCLPAPATEPLPFDASCDHDPTEPASVRTEEALAAVASMSRRIDDLARELNCLGYFDDDDRPRAA